jgi:hypothetical protein
LVVHRAEIAHVDPAFKEELYNPPRDKVLRFDFSTAHGAYDSGVRAAEQAVASFAVVR